MKKSDRFGCNPDRKNSKKELLHILVLIAQVLMMQEKKVTSGSFQRIQNVNLHARQITTKPIGLDINQIIISRNFRNLTYLFNFCVGGYNYDSDF